MGTLTLTLTFNGNLDQKINRKIKKNFDGKGGIWRRKIKPRNGKGKGVGGIGTDKRDIRKES